MLRLVSFFDLESLDSLGGRLGDVSTSILRSNFWLHHSMLKKIGDGKKALLSTSLLWL